jgi:hypothetical protein
MPLARASACPGKCFVGNFAGHLCRKWLKFDKVSDEVSDKVNDKDGPRNVQNSHAVSAAYRTHRLLSQKHGWILAAQSVPGIAHLH